MIDFLTILFQISVANPLPRLIEFRTIGSRILVGTLIPSVTKFGTLIFRVFTVVVDQIGLLLGFFAPCTG